MVKKRSWVDEDGELTLRLVVWIGAVDKKPFKPTRKYNSWEHFFDNKDYVEREGNEFMKL
jgi:hypothetical protein